MKEEMQIKKLEGILELLETDRASTDEVVEALTMVLEIVEKVKVDLDQKMATNKGEMTEEMKEMMKEMEEMEAKMKEMHTKMSEKQAVDKKEIMEYCDTEMRKMEEMMPEMPDLRPLERKINEVEAKIPTMPKMPDVEPILGEIDELKDKVKELEEKVKKSGGRSFFGGGFNYSAMSLHIIDDETPTGDVDGVNTEFTLANTPSPATSLKVYLNGQRMRVTEDYTLSGKTLTFLSAPLTGSILLVDYRT
jgi:seryl-tRNA synthetase